MSEDEDEIEGIEDFQPSEWAIIMDKKIEQMKELYEELPSTYKAPLIKLLEKMGEIISDNTYIALDNERKLKSFIESNYKLDTLNELFKPKEQKEDKPSGDMFT